MFILSVEGNAGIAGNCRSFLSPEGGRGYFREWPNFFPVECEIAWFFLFFVFSVNHDFIRSLAL